MEKIDGIDLAALAEESRKELLRGREAAVKRQLLSIYNNIETWRGEIKQAEATVAKRKDGVAKALAKIDKIKSGDWTALDEEKKPDAGAANG